MFQPLLALFSVLGLIWLIYRVFLRLRPSFLGAHADGPSMRLAGRLSLGDKRHLLLVEVEGRRFVLGATPQEVSLLAELGERTADELEPCPEKSAQDLPGSPFGRRFLAMLAQVRQEGRP